MKQWLRIRNNEVPVSSSSAWKEMGEGKRTHRGPFCVLLPDSFVTVEFGNDFLVDDGLDNG